MLPVSLGLLTIGLLLASVALVSAVDLSNSSNGDQRTKQAIAAADAGLQAAGYRMNSLQQTVDDISNPLRLFPCVLPSIDITTGAANALTVSGSLNSATPGWCPATLKEKVGNRGTFSYQLTPTAAVSAKLSVGGTPQVALSLERKVVATGTYTSNGRTVTRRVLGDFTALDGTNLLNPNNGGYAVVGVNSVSLSSSAAIGLSSEAAPVLSGGTVALGGSSKICGNTIYSSGSTPSLNCSGFTATLDAADARAFTSQLTSQTRPSGMIVTPSACTFVLVTGCQSSASGGNPGTVTINGLPLGLLAPTIPAGATLDVCQLNITSGQLTALGTSSNPSRIYVEQPNTHGCGSTTGINITQTGQFCEATVAVGICTPLVGLTDPTAFQVITGPGANLTFNTNIGASLVPSYVTIDAPEADLTVKGSGALIGGVIAKTVTMDNSGSVRTKPTLNIGLGNLLSLPLKLLPIYTLKSYTECSTTPPVASKPMSGC